MKTMIAATFVAAMMLAVPANVNAGLCPVNDVIDIAGTLYVHDRPGDGSPYGSGLFTGAGTWFYAESNNVPGLQLSGGTSVLDEADNWGGGCTNGDLLLL